MTAAGQKKRGATRKNMNVKHKTVTNRRVFCIQKTGSNMEYGFAILMRHNKRIVGFAPTIEIARAGLNAVAVPFRQNYQIVPYINRVPANER